MHMCICVCLHTSVLASSARKAYEDSWHSLTVPFHTQHEAMPTVGARHRFVQKAKGHWKNSFCKTVSCMSLQWNRQGQTKFEMIGKETKVNYLVSRKHQVNYKFLVKCEKLTTYWYIIIPVATIKDTQQNILKFLCQNQLKWNMK